MQGAVDEFLEYTSSYLTLLNDSCDIYNIKLKIDHTFRVVDLCGEIAKSLELSEDDVTLAKLCGLLHDIARFEQWKRYKTFADSKSIDHGDFGVEILKENNFIRRFNKDEKLDNLILKIVKNHNKYKIEENLSEREKLFCNIVRDADKIDILYLYTIEEISLNTNDDDFSDEVYECLLNQNPISRSLKKTKADMLAISLGFVFDFNFNISYQMLKDRKYYNKEIEIYINKSNNKEFKKKLENLKNVINKYIDGRCNNVR